MTQQEQQEYNKRCAMFLGYKYYAYPAENPGWRKDKGHLMIRGYYLERTTRNLRFHSDWNMIHMVVEKINTSQLTTEMNGIKDSIGPYVIIKQPIIQGLIDSSIDDVAKAIDNFLIWFNKNSK